MKSLLNKFLGFFTFKHPFQPTLLISLIISSLTFKFGFSAYKFFIGLGLWSLVEYVLHRWVFHAIHFKEPYRTMATELHLAHHKAPEIKEYTLAPFFVTLFLSGIVFLILLGITASVSTSCQILNGIYCGYALYEWFHYATHNLDINFFNKSHHLYHHYKNPKFNFGVTSPLWDYLLGTKKH